MKIGLIFLLAFVVITQQFYLQRPNVPMLWFSSPPHRFINYYHPLEDEHHQNALAFHRQVSLNRSIALKMSFYYEISRQLPPSRMRIQV